MSRRSFLPRATPASTSLTPTAAVPTPAAEAATRAPLPHVHAGRGTPEIPTLATVRAQGATERDVGAVLARIADLHDQLAHAQRDLSSVLQNCLAGVRETRDITSVERPTRLLTVDDVAERLQLGARTVRRMRARGQLPPAIDLYSVLRWDEATIEAWIEGRRER